jgi:pentatricopeptide repeat protein
MGVIIYTAMSKYLNFLFITVFFEFVFLVNSFGRNGRGLEAIELYRKMSHHLRNEVSHICALNACSHAGLLDEARTIFNEINIKTEQITTIMVCLFIY